MRTYYAKHYETSENLCIRMRKIGDPVLRVRSLSTYVLLLSRATPHKSHDARKCLYLKCIGRRREARWRCLRCQAAYNGSGLPDRSLSPRRRLLSSSGGGDPLRKMTITSPKIRLIKRSVNVPRDHPGNCHFTSPPGYSAYRDALRHLAEEWSSDV